MDQTARGPEKEGIWYCSQYKLPNMWSPTFTKRTPKVTLIASLIVQLEVTETTKLLKYKWMHNSVGFIWPTSHSILDPL